MTETTFLVDDLLVRHRPGRGASVLYVHGATFPSALSISYRIDGVSWMDDLSARGLDVWAFDFLGYGGSARPAAMLDGPPFGRAPDAARQIERVAAAILERRERLALLAHSWGTLPAGIVAARRPAWLDRLVLFGPICRRDEPAGPVPATAHVVVTRDDQWRAFQAGVPDGTPSPIAPAVFDAWAAAYGDAVRVPAGPQVDIAEAWSGRLPYDPRDVAAPTLAVRGEWDAVTSAPDLDGLRGVTTRTLARGTHRMHLESNRAALFDAVGGFL